jgi:predicted ribonuclease YlaK
MLLLEAGLQVEWLSEVLLKVERMAARFSAPGAVAVLDTNVLLHFKPLDEIEWATIIGSSPVQVVVPLGVVDELDAKKAIRGKLGGRARKRARLLDQHVFGGGGVREDVDVEVLEFSDLDSDAHRRAAVPVDTEVLDVCEALKTYSSDSPVYVVTGDLGMKVRAQARGIEIREMLEDDRQVISDAEEAG